MVQVKNRVGCETKFGENWGYSWISGTSVVVYMMKERQASGEMAVDWLSRVYEVLILGEDQEDMQERNVGNKIVLTQAL